MKTPLKRKNALLRASACCANYFWQLYNKDNSYRNEGWSVAAFLSFLYGIFCSRSFLHFEGRVAQNRTATVRERGENESSVRPSQKHDKTHRWRIFAPDFFRVQVRLLGKRFQGACKIRKILPALPENVRINLKLDCAHKKIWPQISADGRGCFLLVIARSQNKKELKASASIRANLWLYSS